MALLAYALGAGLSAVAASYIAPVTLVTYDMGLSLASKALWWPSWVGCQPCGGGHRRPAPGRVGGLCLGMFASGIKDAIAFLALFVFAARTVPCTS